MKNNICTHQNCDLKLHKNLDKCVLHCHKNNYHTDKSSGLLSEFYKEKYSYSNIIVDYWRNWWLFL